jgi:hypothetical protein
MGSPTVPLTVVLGSSPAAKAEVLTRLAGDDPGRMAVVCAPGDEVPPGTLAVRGAERVAEQSLGCPCCALRLDVRRALFRLLARRHRPGRIVILASAGGLLASVGEDGRVVLWDPAETADPLERAALGAGLAKLSWRPDGRALAVGGTDGGISVLDCSARVDELHKGRSPGG